MAKRKYRPVPPGVIQTLQNVDNPWCRALACCQVGVIGDTDAARELLRSCLGVDPYSDALIGLRLEIRALPLSRSRSPSRRKVWTAPNRLPSLFASDDCEMQLSQSAVAEAIVPAELEGANWAAEIALATLSTDLIDLVVDSAGAINEFAYLSESISDEQKAKILEEWKPVPKQSYLAPNGNLFHAFGIELPSTCGCDHQLPELRSRKKSASSFAVAPPSLFVVLEDEK